MDYIMSVQEEIIDLVAIKERTLDKEDLESWPLLRPDKVATLPTDLLRASVTELDSMCRQTCEETGGLKKKFNDHTAVSELVIISCAIEITLGKFSFRFPPQTTHNQRAFRRTTVEWQQTFRFVEPE